ncbi:cytochrome oxidase assembly protein ShyY1 [Haloactinospora alba]|uniref:SURF1-like protein n=1 Tax=Haloactinospora alba TaxID=405555 RepID=A0A543NAG3_9ACTN|nr:cytochrome oxidase assembly protein ShyY1 [Haloactinospora alba]
MRFPLLRPRWIGLHLTAVLAVTVCFVCGYWQFVRAQEPTRETITTPVQDLSEATSLGTVLEPGAYMPQDEANRAVTATGRYDTDAQLLAPALSPEDERGYYVIVPLVTDDGTALAVNRGWVPEDEAQDVGSLSPLPEGTVTATGWLRPPQKGEEEEAYVPVSSPEEEISRIAPSLLVNEWPYQLYEGYLVLGEQDPAAPEAGAAQTQPRNIPPPQPPPDTVWNWRNLSYAAQWGVFGVAVIVFWAALVRRELTEGGTGGKDGSHGTGTGSPDSGTDSPSGEPAASQRSVG